MNGKKATRRCKCGYLDDASLGCGRAPKCAKEYQSKISGPLFDRIDLHVDVPAVSPADLSLPPPRENSTQVAARVSRVRDLQRTRYEKLASGTSVRANSAADGDLLERVAAPDAAGRELLTRAAERLRLSARGYHRMLRVARTLADMDGGDGVRRVHIAEALSYRRITVGSS
jgi:magnesium chelatase family protein